MRDAQDYRALHYLRKEWSVVLVVVFFILLFLFDFPILNYLSLTNSSTASTLLSTIVGALSSIMGILIAIVLVAFEISRSVYSYYTFKTFFRNEEIRELFILYVTTILISLISMSQINGDLTLGQIGQIYLCLYLFVASIIVLFTYIRRIFLHTQSEENIIRIIDEINGFTVSTFIDFVRPIQDSSSIEVIKNNPVYLLIDIGKKALKEDNTLIPEIVLVESTRRLCTLLKEHSNPEVQKDIIRYFLVLISNYAGKFATQAKSFLSFVLLKVYYDIHLFCSEEKLELEITIELNEFLENFLLDNLKAGYFTVAEEGLGVVRAVLLFHLEHNIPSEEEVTFYYDDRDSIVGTGLKTREEYKKQRQWDHVSRVYIEIIRRVIDKAIDLDARNTYQIGLMHLGLIPEQITKLEIGDRQKELIINICTFYTRGLILSGAEKELFTEHSYLGGYEGGDLYSTLCLNKSYSKRQILILSSILLELGKRGVFCYSILDNMATFIRLATEGIDKDVMFKEAIILVLNKFGEIRKIAETGETINKKVFYVRLHRQISSIKSFMQKYNKKDALLSRKINQELRAFNKYNEYESEITKREQVLEWPDLSKR